MSDGNGQLLEVGRKDDGGKARYDLLSPNALESVAHVLGHGADRYGADNWRRVPQLRSRYYAAALRHVLAWRRGERLDVDSGRPHLAHAICCLLFLLESEIGPAPALDEQP